MSAMRWSVTGVYQHRSTIYINTVVTEVTVETVVTVMTVVVPVTGLTVIKVGLVLTVVKIVASNDCNGRSDRIDRSISCDINATGVT